MIEFVKSMSDIARVPVNRRKIPAALIETLAIVLLALPMLLPLLRAAMPETHDAQFHYYRSIVLAWHLGHGDLLPRLASDLGYGYGLPVFNFYGPLFYYPPALLILLGLDAAIAVNLTLLVLLVLAGYGMLRLGREWFGPLASWLAAAAFLYSPYLLLDLYWRGAFPEVLGLALLPWGLLFFSLLLRAPDWASWRADWFGATAVTGLVALAHNISIVWSLPMLAASIGAGWLLGEGGNRPAIRWRLVSALCALGLGLALASFFLLPAVTELRWIQASRLTGSPQRDYHNNFLAAAELLSLPKTFDPTQIAPPRPRSLGLPQLGLAALGLWFVWREPRKTRWLWLGLLLAAAASVALTLALSAPVWDALPPMKYIQFPWRWLGPASLMLALLGGYGASALLSHAGRAQAYAFGLAMVLIVTGNLSWAFATYFPPQPGAGIDAVRDFERTSGLVGLSTEGEFVPIWVTQMPASDSLRDRVVAGDLLARVRPDALPAGVQLQSADYQLTGTTARFLSNAPAEVTFDWFYFPGWIATVNGQPALIHIQSPSGLIGVSLPAGVSEVRLTFGLTPDRVAGGMISLLALLAILVGGVHLAAWRSKTGEQNPGMAPASPLAEPHTRPPAGEITTGWRWASLSAVIGLSLAIWRLGWVDRGLTPWMQMRFEGSAVRGVGQAANVLFGDQMALVGWDLAPAPVPAGNTAQINLYWRALQALVHDYSVAVHVLNEQGVLIAQADSQHPGGTPTSIWPLDRYDLDEHHLTIPAGTPPGSYRLLVGVYHIETGERLEALSDSGLPLPDRLFQFGTIEVARPGQSPSASELGIRHSLGAVFGSLRLIGLDLSADSVRPGDDLMVTSYWKSSQAPGADYEARFELTDAAGAKYPIDTAPVTPSYPTHQWTAQETLRGTNFLRVPPETAPGQAALTLTLIDSSGVPLAPPVRVGQVTIEPIARNFVAIDTPVKVGTTLGGVIELSGTNALAAQIKPGDDILITLDWHVIGPVTQRYTVFVHLLDASGALRAQIDSQPLAGARPTTSWLPGEYIRDPYRLSTPSDLPPGLYRLEVGMYLPESGERLAVLGAVASSDGTSIVLGQVKVNE